MKVKQILMVGLAFAFVLTTLACEDTADPLSPVDAQYAKGGKGKPPTSAPVELLEYYVYQDVGGANQVHILASGNFPMVNLNVVQDYIFNGIRDDNHSIFYEYTTAAPLPVPLDGNGVFDQATEAWHIDIPWDGETWWWDYSDEQNSVRMVAQFPDFPHVGLNGGTADPYAFEVRFQKENGDFLGGGQPQGIILGGVETNQPSRTQPSDASFHRQAGTIYSYATHESAREGVPVFIDHLSLDESSLECSVRTISEGRGKNKTRRQVTEVSGTAQVVLGDQGGSIPDAWIDVMFATGDVNDPELADSFITTHGSERWATGWGLTARFDGARSSLDLQVAAVYVYATDLQQGTVYDPTLNNPGGEPSWYTINASITDLGSWPMALTMPVTVACGK